jgi:hypothetical protein
MKVNFDEQIEVAIFSGGVLSKNRRATEGNRARTLRMLAALASTVLCACWEFFPVDP